MNSDNNENPFALLGSRQVPTPKGEPIGEEEKGGELHQRIQRLIDSSDLFLFMKGVPEAPRCGFSANVVGILNSLGLAFKSFDILQDPEIRQGVKEYSEWPTYPQFYVRGEFIGGNDIVTEMFEKGELQSLLEKPS